MNKIIRNTASIKEFYRFGYDHFLRRAQTIDVSWFNERKMPYRWKRMVHGREVRTKKNGKVNLLFIARHKEISKIRTAHAAITISKYD